MTLQWTRRNGCVFFYFNDARYLVVRRISSGETLRFSLKQNEWEKELDTFRNICYKLSVLSDIIKSQL
jgi:hypothetical protein